jgi:nitrite reductase/ring-hydroxylating ferredoxin subunit
MVLPLRRGGKVTPFGPVGNRRLALSERIDLCGTGDVPPGGTKKVETSGLTLAVYNVGGTFYVTDDHCTHGPGSLSDGMLSGFEIECDFHQGCFDVRTGAVTAPPCMIPVKTYPAAVEGGRVIIEA